MTKERKPRDFSRVNGDIVGELSDYFQHEDLGPPAIVTEPRAGTCTLEPRPPQWGPGANPEMMALVYRRLTYAQRWFSKNIFAVLRARYGTVNRRDKVAEDQAKSVKFGKWIDWAEHLYAKARPMFPREDRIDHERRRLRAKEERIFGEPLE